MATLRQLEKEFRARLSDQQLRKYEKAQLRDYVADCCDSKYYIEAYTLSLQYIEELLCCFVDVSGASALGIIVKTLHGVGFVSEELHALFLRAKSDRDTLAHKILKDTKRRIAIAKRNKEHKQDLLTLINEFEELFLKLWGQFIWGVPNKNNNKDCVEKAFEIIVRRVISENNAKFDKLSAFETLDLMKPLIAAEIKKYYRWSNFLSRNSKLGAMKKRAQGVA